MGGVERGERNLTLKSVERLALTLNLDPTELLMKLTAESASKLVDKRTRRPTT